MLTLYVTVSIAVFVILIVLISWLDEQPNLLMVLFVSIIWPVFLITLAATAIGSFLRKKRRW